MWLKHGPNDLLLGIRSRAKGVDNAPPSSNPCDPNLRYRMDVSATHPEPARSSVPEIMELATNSRVAAAWQHAGDEYAFNRSGRMECWPASEFFYKLIRPPPSFEALSGYVGYLTK